MPVRSRPSVHHSLQGFLGAVFVSTPTSSNLCHDVNTLSQQTHRGITLRHALPRGGRAVHRMGLSKRISFSHPRLGRARPLRTLLGIPTQRVRLLPSRDHDLQQAVSRMVERSLRHHGDLGGIPHPRVFRRLADEALRHHLALGVPCLDLAMVIPWIRFPLQNQLPTHLRRSQVAAGIQHRPDLPCDGLLPQRIPARCARVISEYHRLLVLSQTPRKSATTGFSCLYRLPHLGHAHPHHFRHRTHHGALFRIVAHPS